MSEIRDALTVLELPARATRVEVRHAYLKLCKVWHPDRFPGDPELQAEASERIKQINAAYKMLMDYLKNQRQEASQSGPSAGEAQRAAERRAAEEARRREQESRRAAERRAAEQASRRTAEEARRRAREAKSGSNLPVVLTVLFALSVLFLVRMRISPEQEPTPSLSTVTTPSSPLPVAPPAASSTARSAAPPPSAPTPSAPITTGAGDFRVQANWGKLEEGMTQQHVIALLGARTSRSGSEFVYEGQAGNFGVVRGTVSFDSTGRVIRGYGYSAPPSFIPLPE